MSLPSDPDVSLPGADPADPAAEQAPDRAPDRALDRALAAALQAPALPPRFRLNLMVALHHEAVQDLATRRVALETEHARQLAALHAGHVRLRRDTLGLVLAAAFAAGAVATVALPWLREVAGMDAAVLMPLLAVALGASAGLGVWVNRMGLPRW